jgi:hypothetical protein
LLIVHAHIRLQTQCVTANNDNDQIKHIHLDVCMFFFLQQSLDKI